MAKWRRYLVPEAPAVCTRSTLDVLALPLPFTQTRLLDPPEFAAEAARRKVGIQPAQLEVLHRARLLVPFFEVSLAKGDPRRAVDFADSQSPRIGTSTFIMELYRGAREGRASDPRTTRFRAWPTMRARTLWPTRVRGYLYSWHQLLVVRWLEPVLRRMQLDRATRTWSLPTSWAPSVEDVSAADSWRGLAVTLAAIDARYWPAITHTVRFNAEAWREFSQSFDPKGVLAWTNLSLDDISRGAEQLRGQAYGIDVLGAFYDLVRRADPQAWETLRGDALLAMDFRTAAEALDLFADDVGRELADAAALDATPTAALRLSTRRRTTDAVLTELGVSPHPSVVVGVEGDTEELLLPRVFDVLGIPSDPEWIRVAEFGGVDKDLTNLAKFAAGPVIGIDHGDYVELDRPVTRFLVLVDAEKRYSDRLKRAKQRLLLLDAVAAALPPDLRGDLYSADAHIVEIRTWGKLPFEFAHFTDRQLADAIGHAAKTPHPSGPAGLLAAVRAERGRPRPNVENLWRDGRWSGARLSKPALADACWPTLEAKIERAIASGSGGPPIMRAAIRAWELASMPHRNHMALKRH